VPTEVRIANFGCHMKKTTAGWKCESDAYCTFIQGENFPETLYLARLAGSLDE